MANFADTMRIYLLLFGLTIVTFGCRKQRPVACFVLPEDIVEVNEPVKFKDCSEKASGYEWDFGDGNFSDQPSPEHTYGYESDFKITLKVNGENGSDELVRFLNVTKIFTTNLVQGQFKGTYVEQYSTDPDRGLIYEGVCDIYAIDHKRMRVTMPRGGFDSRPIGTNNNFTFSEFTNQSVDRIKGLTTLTGSYVHTSTSLSFTLSGIDPINDSIPWTIRFNGTK